jgi:N-acetylneuraminic acid mutarotase
MKYCSISHLLSFCPSLSLTPATLIAAGPVRANLRLSRLRRFLAPFPFAVLSLCLISAFATPHDAKAQANEWTWEGGSNMVGQFGTVGQVGVYGTLGVPAAGNIPGARNLAASWTDKSGNFWLFGGNAYGYFNDFWEYSPSSKEWTWVGGSDTIGSTGVNPGVYGTLGTPAAGNIPGSRIGSAYWTDSHGNFWLFGGNAADSAGTLGYLNDLWEFNPSSKEWTWVRGSNLFPGNGNVSLQIIRGVYGTLGTAAAGNVPGGRYESVSWIDASGDLWLFGGNGWDSNGDFGNLNDLWEFNPSTAQWTWKAGSKVVNQSGVYGTLGTPAAGNTPDARYAGAGWIDGSGNLWLFGGSGYDSDPSVGEGALNDLWEFNPTSNEWTWMGGSNTVNQPGFYGTQQTPGAGNTPGARYNPASWTDSSGNFWLFGGFGNDSTSNQNYLNDLWVFDPSTNEWAWATGTSTFSCSECNPPGIYGTLGVAAAGNTPGSRTGPIVWTDGSGDFWFFGGYGFDSAGAGGFLYDLWKYEPAAFSPPIAQVTPNPLNFGNVSCPATVVEPITISNIGGGTLNVSPGAINGPSYTFVGNTCGAGVTAGNSCNISVQYSPVGVGPHDDYSTSTPTPPPGRLRSVSIAKQSASRPPSARNITAQSPTVKPRQSN